MKLSEAESSRSEPLFKHRQPIVSPERLPIENANRHTEDMIIGGFPLCAIVSGLTRAIEIFAVIFRRHTQTRDQVGDRVGLIGLELALEEQLECFAAGTL